MPWDDVCAVRDLLANYEGLWAVVGGWAVDLALGRQTRLHSDVDIGIMRSELDQFLQAVAGYECVVAKADGPQLVTSVVDLRLPVREFIVRSVPLIDVWIYDDGRDTVRHPPDWRIALPKERFALKGPCDIPYAAPEWMLMWCSQWASPKTEYMFVRLSCRLSPEGRAWLMQALMTHNPKHPWVRRLAR